MTRATPTTLLLLAAAITFILTSLFFRSSTKQDGLPQSQDGPPWFVLVTPTIPKYFYVLKVASLRSLAADSESVRGLVIAASETDESTAKHLKEELKTLYGKKFGQIIVDSTTDAVSTGLNRNRGANRALRDLLSGFPLNKSYVLFIDSDDEYHPQRLSVLRTAILARNYPAEVLHNFVSMNYKKASNWPPAINLSSIPIVEPAEMWRGNRNELGRQKWEWMVAIAHRVHNGHLTVRADVLLHLQFPDKNWAEDSDFNHQVLAMYNNTIGLSLPLSLYYNRHSPKYEDLV